MKNKYFKYNCSNGLRIVLLPDNSKETVTTLVVFGVGSRFETEPEAGISHVLEHMHYKGTKKRPKPLQIAEFIENIGGEHNAFTSKEYTGYYTKVAAKYISESIDFLSDILKDSLFDQIELEKEKNVILQELNMYEDLPMEIVSSKFEEALFGNNSLGRDVIGFKQSIKSLNRQNLVDFRDKYYTSENCVVAVVGNYSSYSEDEIVKLVEKNFDFANSKLIQAEALNLNDKKAIAYVNKKTEQTHLVVGFKGVSNLNDDKYCLKLLAMILGGSMSSRMFTEIREKRGLAYAVRTSSSSYHDTGAIETYAGVEHDKLELALSAILNEYKIIANNINIGDLDRAKQILSGRLLINFEDSSYIANNLALQELLTGNIVTPSETIEKYAKISLDEIKNCARRYFNNNSMALSIIGPRINKQNIEKIFTI